MSDERERTNERGGATDTGCSGDGRALPRRDFLVAGSVFAGAALAGCAHGPTARPAGDAKRPAPPPEPAAGRIRVYRPLGRTGFQVSDIGLGCGRLGDPNVVRYAFDKGVNFIDTADGYGNGSSERAIGQAMVHLQRDKVFLVTKLKLEDNESEQKILERVARGLERLKTSYVDALYMHSVTQVSSLKHPGFHAAFRRLRADGKVKHAGISCHGPRGKGDSLERVLLAAAEDGRFDLMLLVHSFMTSEQSEKVLRVCKEKQIAATLMKTRPARLKLEAFNPDAPTDEQARLLGQMIKSGAPREVALAKIKEMVERQRSEIAQNRSKIDAFVARHGIRTEEQLAARSVQWVLNKPGVSTALVSMNDFETIDAFVALSGTRLVAADERQLRDWAEVYGREYCRHGCNACAAACPRGVPVSTVMRYAYYACQGAERHAMAKYAALAGGDGSRCLGCEAPCAGACPHGVAIQAQLLRAHQLLTVG